MAAGEKRIRMLFSLYDSVKSSLADFRASNPRTKHVLDQVNITDVRSVTNIAENERIRGVIRYTDNNNIERHNAID